MVGLDDLNGLFQPQGFCSSMKSHWASQSALEHPGCPLLYAEGVNSLPASPFRQHGAAVGSKPLPSRKASLRGADTCVPFTFYLVLDV